MNEESYRAFLRAYGSMTAAQVWRMLRELPENRRYRTPPAQQEGPVCREWRRAW